MNTKKKITEDMREFILKFKFQWMLTFTFKNHIVSETVAWRSFTECIKHAERKIYGNCRPQGCEISYAAFAEKGADGSIHIHALIRDNKNKFYFRLNDKYKENEDRKTVVPFVLFDIWVNKFKKNHEVKLNEVLNNCSRASIEIDKSNEGDVVQYVFKHYVNELKGYNVFSDYKFSDYL